MFDYFEIVNVNVLHVQQLFVYMLTIIHVVSEVLFFHLGYDDSVFH